MNARADRATLWMPVWYDAGYECDGMWFSGTHYGTALSDKGMAWAEARRMCESIDGIGFSVQRVEPINSEGASTKAPRNSPLIQSAQHSLRGEQ